MDLSQYQGIILAGAVAMALLVIVIRIRATRKPASIAKILLPPLGMSTGFLMFIAPQVRISPLYALIACFVGCLFSYPLISSSKMYVSGGEIYLQRSKVFVVVLLGLLVIRMSLHTYIEKFVTLPQTGAIFFLLAFCMLLPWRATMYFQYRDLQKSIQHPGQFANFH